MANAMVLKIDNAILVNTPNITWSIMTVYVGADVPDGFQKTEVSFDTAPTITPAQLSSAVVAAVQAQAIVLGYSVATGHTVLPSYSAQ